MAKTKDKKEIKDVELVKEHAQKLLKLMGSKAEVEVSEDKENEAIEVNIITESERGLLIGNHGETLISFQAALGMMLKQKVGEWRRVTVDVGDWREKQEEYLKNLAIQTADRVKETGNPQSLYNLNPSQRRIIHVVLSDIKGIETESIGEGEERYLVVKPSRK
ncbi:hypothetical protein A2W13_01260 [Candidatus Woesebacteria bacterium RBG_16_36_11]|uniref:R3H domain-containing protein n=3 Tax=Candidatus Woeseibacteriota TaxID=1752722 RepID=A0A1F7XD55_9BACT|nr:MAG: hypothetical protein A2Z67_03265 [Candidatus Woesebacteria bacterium RBG_13_36_22]OGM12255.1 MAG: hypothetical protein A2W13_01260 [Candidatus Woesebacteria bacterium RBG_16_36_11]OGM16327.1 MAG: hypothetical protein A2V55_01255 [Candidatus Woesebacteria bacterium RBG_19FT_COMBO_37_29]